MCAPTHAKPINAQPTKPLIFGLSGPQLTAQEHEFFTHANPLGFILFARNITSPQATRELCRDLRAAVGREDAPILVDQEGGLVQRLRPPHWHALPAMGTIGALFEADPCQGMALLQATMTLLAMDMHTIDASVACTPVLDCPVQGADPVIGDRAFSPNPQTIIALGGAVLEHLTAHGILPVIKHIPGHGRSNTDSHKSLPCVTAPQRALEQDFAPFHALSHAPFAMTAHVAYSALDGRTPATLSKTIVQDVIRGTLGFKGLLLSDDLVMGALAGDAHAEGALNQNQLAQNAQNALSAGCDVLLHCDGNLDSMRALSAAVPDLEYDLLLRYTHLEATRQQAKAQFCARTIDVAALTHILEEAQPHV